MMSPTDAITRQASRVAGLIRARMTEATVSMFDEAPYPLADTLSHRGDPGLLGPGSVSWKVIGDVAAFVGGLRGLLIQAAHPEVVAGVADHSRYRADPFGRLSRTSAYVTATTYGAMPEVTHAVGQVQRMHRVVKGVSSRGIPYTAEDPGFSAWVHNALTDSFLVAHQVYGGLPLEADEDDLFVREQRKVGALLGADPMPSTAAELHEWVAGHPELAPTDGMRDVVDFLTDPPLGFAVKAGYLALLQAAIVTLPDRLVEILGIEKKPGSKLIGDASVSGLRWALGYSPTWALALQRCGEPPPPGLFRREPEDVLDRR